MCKPIWCPSLHCYWCKLRDYDQQGLQNKQTWNPFISSTMQDSSDFCVCGGGTQLGSFATISKPKPHAKKKIHCQPVHLCTLTTPIVIPNPIQYHSLTALFSEAEDKIHLLKHWHQKMHTWATTLWCATGFHTANHCEQKTLILKTLNKYPENQYNLRRVDIL